jgi:hypothetical protein
MLKKKPEVYVAECELCGEVQEGEYKDFYYEGRVQGWVERDVPDPTSPSYWHPTTICARCDRVLSQRLVQVCMEVRAERSADKG